MKEQIMNLLTSKGEMKLKDIYNNFEGINKARIRGHINILVNTGKLDRVSIGTYKIKEQV